MREYRFDVVRVVCMTYVVAYFHLSGYVYPHGLIGGCYSLSMALAHASLGLFTFVSGYLLGKKYKFGQYGDAGVWTFYKKRILRVFPLFVLASAALWLIGLNGARATLNGLLCISPFVNPVPTVHFAFCQSRSNDIVLYTTHTVVLSGDASSLQKWFEMEGALWPFCLCSACRSPYLVPFHRQSFCL